MPQMVRQVIECRRGLAVEDPGARIRVFLPPHHAGKHMNDCGPPLPVPERVDDDRGVVVLREEVDIPPKPADDVPDVLWRGGADNGRQRRVRNGNDETVAREVRAGRRVNDRTAGKQHAARIHPSRLVGHTGKCRG